MRVKLLSMLSAVALVTAGLAFVATLLTTGERTAGPDGSRLRVSIARMSVGEVQTMVRPVPALRGHPWPVLVTAESNGAYEAFLGRSPHLGCRVNWINDPDHAHFAVARGVAFEDPCGGAEFELNGVCLGGPCDRGLDHFPIAVTDGEAVVDLSTLIPGAPRTGA